MADLKVGDVVVLKSGGPKMTIMGIGKYMKFDPGAECHWFVDNEVKDELFHLDELQKVEDPFSVDNERQ